MKCDNVQVNHFAARGDSSLCLALLNQCDRALNATLQTPAGEARAMVLSSETISPKEP